MPPVEVVTLILVSWGLIHQALLAFQIRRLENVARAFFGQFGKDDHGSDDLHR